MRINIYAEGFQLTSQLRAFVDLRLLSTLGPFRDRIESAVVHLRARNARSVLDTTSSDVVVRLYPSGEVVPSTTATDGGRNRPSGQRDWRQS